MADQSSVADTRAPPVLQDLPPSAKLVAKTLEYEGALTQAQLADQTRLPGRTVRHALTRLERADLITSRISFTDARQRIYALAVPDGTVTVSPPDRAD